jgi:hypothetical protein
MLNKLLAAGWLALALAACAGAPPRDTTKSAAATAPAGCVGETGSRIPQDACAGIGRSYTQEEIQRTGAVDTGQALRLLDPALRVHGQ